MTLDNNNLPLGWARTTLGQLVTFEYGKSLTKGSRDASGRYAVFGSSGPLGTHSHAFVKEPSLIVGRKGAIGRVHISESPCWPIDTTYYLVPPSQLDLRFLFYALTWLKLGTLDRSTAIPGLNRDDAYSVQVSIPPQPEQKRIVAKIEELFTRVDAAFQELRQAQARLKRYRQAMLKAAVTGELTKEWRETHQAELEPASQLLTRILKERRAKWEADQLAKMEAAGRRPKDDKWKSRYGPPAAPEIEELPGLPESWVWGTVDQSAAFEPNALTDGPFGSNLMTKHYTQSGPRVIRLQNIGDGVFIDEHAFISRKHFEGLRKHQIFGGELAIASLSEISPRACLIPMEIGPAIVKADCIRFSPHSALADAKYLNYVLNSEPTRVRTMDAIHGVGRPRLGLTGIRKIALPLPPLLEQQEIVAQVERCLSIAEAIEKTITQGLVQAERMRQSILKDAFAGKLVSQEPRDEPAELLLARIKLERGKREAEKAAMKKPPRKQSAKRRSKRTQRVAA